MTVASKVLILMCVLSICYKHFKSRRDKTCTDHLDDYDESLILCENKMKVDQCICEELPKRNLQTETVNVSFFVADTSKLSIRKSKVEERKSSGSIHSYKHSITSDKHSSQTTSSSAAISFQTDSDFTSEESTVSAGEDYEIEFTGDEEEECYCHPEEQGRGSNEDAADQPKRTPSVAKASAKSSSHHSRASAKKSRASIPDG